nr:T9SS type B sorting domain-containing protein [uncultured Chryseobacterium sp.]
MQKKLFLLSLFFYVFSFGQTKFQKCNEYYFYENKGQILNQDGKENKEVKYLFHSAGLNVQLRSTGFSYDIYETKKTINPKFNKGREHNVVNRKEFNIEEYTYENLFHRVDIELINSNKNTKIIAHGKSVDYENYYNLTDKPEGITNVHRYQKIIYKNIYNNIDLVFFKPKDSLKPIEYNFILHPGGKVSDIKMKFNGALTSIENNKLLMKVRFGNMQENIPQSWIEGQVRENITVSFKDLGHQIFGFHSQIDVSNKTIVIDPVPTRIWGSYAGGFGEDYGRYKTDSQNTGYLAGATNSSTNIATSGVPQNNIIGAFDAFLMKITKNGQKLWGTYYGTQRDDGFESFDIDENFNIYAGGKINRITSNTDAFLAKFNPDGALIYQKHFIGNSPDEVYTVSYNNNEVFLGGQTMSPNFPILNAAQPTKLSPNGYTDGYIIKLDAATGNTLWSSFFGGSDHSTSIFNIFSSTGDLEVIGATRSQNIPMINPFQPTFGGLSDGLYLRFSKSGALLRSSYYGNSIQERVWEARIVNNTLILAGEFPDVNANPYTIAGIWRINLSNNTIVKAAYPVQHELQLSAYIDETGNVFMAGLSAQINQAGIATPNAYMTSTGPGIKTYMIKYNQNNIKEWGTFYGGNGGTQLGYVTKDNEDYIYFTGMSSNNTTGIATPGTFQQTGGHPSNDVFIAKFKDCSSAGTITSNSPVCSGSTLQLNATGGSIYNWTGPNGFTSTQQNPSIPNATSGNTGTYTCQISGSGDCDGSFTVNVVVGDTAAPIPNVTNLPDITGDCNTIVSSYPTATDICAGTVTATTTDPLTYSLSGTYIIHWTYNDGNGNTSTQNQNVIISSTSAPTTGNVNQIFCATSLPTIANFQITGQNIKWYDANGNILTPGTLLTNGQSYYASQTVNNCESIKTSVQVIINNTPKPIANSVQDFCASSNPKILNLAVNGTVLIYYDAAGNILPVNTPLVNGQTYFVTQTLNNCESEKLSISVTLSQNNVPAGNYRTSLCNSTTGNTMIVDLTSYQSNIIANPNNYIFTYTTSSGNPITNPSNYTLTTGLNIINVRVSTADGCFKDIILELNVNPKPVITLPEDFDFCKGKTVVLDAGSGFAAYLWNTGATSQTITVSAPGNYWVKVTNSFGCENTDDIQLSYSVLGEIVSITISNGTATVIMSSPGNYEYSLDNQNWQNSNVFTNLSLGEYKVYVRTKSGCIIGEKNFSIFNIPNMISPNADGINDQWRIAGLENYSGTEILVYDRKGLIVFRKIIGKKPFEWDGKYNSAPLATGNYWYTIKVSDGRVYNGWLLIKNRN